MTWRVVVIAFIVGIVGLFFYGLGKDPREIPSPLTNQPAPAFTGAQVDGKAFKSDAIKGKVALVSFWATWCTTCKADEPLIDSLHAQFSGNADFVMIGVATQDTKDKVGKYLGSGHRKYLNLIDEDGKLAIDFGVYGVPETYLIDRKGIIVQKIAGPIDEVKLAEQIKKLLGEKAG